jgi:hypothetical protein
MRKPVVRIVLVLSVLTLAGIVALAAAGRHGIVTSQDGRMAIASHGPSHVTPSREPGADGLTLIAGNLSKYPYGTYFCCYGYTITGPQGFLGYAVWVAVPFTPTTTMTAKKIQVSVGYVEGPNGVTLSLNADSGCLPGAAIATANVTNLSDYGDCCTLATAQGGSGVTVNAGTQYWVVVSTGSTTTTTFDAWAFNSTDMRETYAFASYNSSSGGWAASEGLLPGYAVYGQ